MKRFFVTGDCHGQYHRIYNFIQRFGLGEDDTIIVCGDMGLYWNDNKKDAEEKIKTYETMCHGVNLWWIDGNHENFNIIKTFGNKPYKCSPHITYIPRGTDICVKINNETKHLLFVGGADSVDKFWRTENVSWWADETISDEDVEKVKPGYYDYVFTHCCPYEEVQQGKCWLFTLSNISESNAIHNSEKQLQKIFDKIEFGHHYYGHYHVNKQTSEKHTCLYEDFIELK